MYLNPDAYSNCLPHTTPTICFHHKSTRRNWSMAKSVEDADFEHISN